jgi:hypothetical protein
MPAVTWYNNCKSECLLTTAPFSIKRELHRPVARWRFWKLCLSRT